MFGYIVCGDFPRRPQLSEVRLLGARFLSLSMAQPRHPNSIISRRRALLAARRMVGEGVRRAVFPLDFPYTSLFIRQGILPVDPLPLRRALAPLLVRRDLERLGIAPTQAVLALSGDRLTPALADAVRTLSMSFRYVLLDVPSGAEELARSLRRGYGISLLLRPTLQQLHRADALLLYAPRSDLACENPLFYALYPGALRGRGVIPLTLPAAIRSQVEPNCSPDQLLSALFSQGALTLDTILSEIPC